MIEFDTCVVVASNPKQTSSFAALIDARKRSGLYPREIDFVCVSDPKKGRVGSGGGTLWALHKVHERVKRGQRLLMINAGGESRRMPAYAPEGKLFAPIPVATSALQPPVLLDLQLTLFLKYPWRDGELVVSSGDVVIDFDNDSIRRDRGEVCGFAAPASLEVGARHGVFRFDYNHGRVLDFYQKQSVEYLAKNAVLEGSRLCGLDLGPVAFSRDRIDRLFALGDLKLPDGRTIVQGLATGEIRFELYLEVLTACLQGIRN
jgi:hypothetical protein